jgi:NAD(P)-dependent dehydrogenase (short-subunit alcohol dehydrogenase family)
MTDSLAGKRVLVIGRPSGIAGAVVQASCAAGARVIAAGRDLGKLELAYAGTGVRAETVDLTSDASIAALAGRIDRVDHVVSTASARARGTLDQLERDDVRLSFDTKVIGPLMLAKHVRSKINPAGGSLVLFSGVAAFQIHAGTLAVAITNGAADTLTRSLAVEMAPIRVNAISPGTIDTGAWDALGEQGKADYYAHVAGSNAVRRIGTPGDIAHAVLFCMENLFLTGQTLKVDGGQQLA